MADESASGGSTIVDIDAYLASIDAELREDGACKLKLTEDHRKPVVRALIGAESKVSFDKVEYRLCCGVPPFQPT